jgi:hypothetical protein
MYTPPALFREYVQHADCQWLWLLLRHCAMLIMDFRQGRVRKSFATIPNVEIFSEQGMKKWTS